MSNSPIVTFDSRIKAFIPKNVSLGNGKMYTQPVLMVRLLAVALAFFLASTNAAACSTVSVSKYRIPQGYTGWVRVYFGVEKKPPLQVENDTLIFDIHPNGRLLTSSGSDVDDGSKLRFVYYDGQTETPLVYGEPKALIHDVNFGSFGTMGIQIGNEVSKGSQTSYVEFFVGTKEQFTVAEEQFNKQDFWSKYQEDFRQALNN